MKSILDIFTRGFIQVQKTAFFATALLFAFSLFVQAEMVDTYQFQNQDDRTRAVELAKSLRCPQCQNQNLVESNSPIAYDLRLEVYKMVDEGKSNQQIIDQMTARFGDFVNYKPPFKWNTALLWLLPVALLILAAALLYFSNRKKSALSSVEQGSALEKEQRYFSVNSEPYSDPKQKEQKTYFFGKSNHKLSFVIFFLLIAIPTAYYFSLDRFSRVQQGEQSMIEQHNQNVEMNDEHKNENVIEKIQNKLRTDPNNAETWLQLGEAYVQNNEFDSALVAYSNAEKISGSKPNILGLAATALYYQAGQQVTPKVEQLLNEALTKDKNEVSSLSLLATIALENRQYQQASAYLQQLLDSGNAAVDRRSVIQRMKMLDFLQRVKSVSQYSENIIIGAGAAGLFCAAQLAKLGKSVTVFDNGKKIGRKILMSGGGFCNFTNLEVTPAHYLSQNPHFVKSALARYTNWDFISLVAEQGIAYHEKELGQLFCDDGAEQIVEMLKSECDKYGAKILLRSEVSQVERIQNDEKVRFVLQVNSTQWQCKNLIVATGGLSMPGLGATPFGYQIAEQFGIPVIPPRASLVPFTYQETDKFLTALSGISLPVTITAQSGKSFHNQLLFTHRGISGPAVLQISNYWQPTESVEIDLLPNHNVEEEINQAKQHSPKQMLKTILVRLLPKKLVELWIEQGIVQDEVIANISKVRVKNLVDFIHHWQFTPNGTEGYRTAEVTMGGVDTKVISSKTMESNQVSGLYFIGEVLDVTGWLGGYNFQWAWSSAYACSQGISEK